MVAGRQAATELLHDYLTIVRTLNRDVLLYLVSGALVGFASSSGIYNLLLNIYLLRLGHDVGLIGLVNATGAGVYALLCIPAGIMGRLWGVRTMIIVGLIFIAVGNVMLPFAEFVEAGWQTWWILLARMPRAFGFALTIVNAGPFLIGITTRFERTHVFSVQAAIWPLAGFGGNLVGGILPELFASLMGVTLDSPAPYRYPLFLAALLIVPAILAVSSTRPSTRQFEDNDMDCETPFPKEAVAMVAIAGFCAASTIAVQQTFFNVYMDDFLGESTPVIGACAAIAMLVSGIAALTTPFIVASMGQRGTIVISTLLACAALLPVIFFTNWIAAGCTYILIQSLASVRFPTMTIFHQEIVPSRWRSTMSAVSSMAIGGCFMLTGTVGGQVISNYSYPTLFTFTALVSIAGAVLFGCYFNPNRTLHLKTQADEAESQ